jgi:hypothetical protein
MAHTHSQDWDTRITALDKVNEKNRKDISDLTSNIASINSHLTPLETLPTTVTNLTAMCQQSQEAVNNLTALFKQAQDPFSSAPPYNPEGIESSHSTSLHSNHFQQDLRLPRVEVNKFDGSDPTGWVTQMEHYFSLHGITDELAKLHYGVLYLDPK